jgi:hypothetical protein
MYSTSDPPDAPAPVRSTPSTRVSGAVVPLGQDATGIRRAEIEGQQSRYVADPSRLRQVAEAYAERHPAAPALVEVRIVIRWYDIQDDRPTGRWTDRSVVTWQAAR